jgi:hypothetical protein
MEVFFISLFGIWADCERIYYAELTPLRLKQYIKQSNGKALCSIKLSLLNDYSKSVDLKIRDFNDVLLLAKIIDFKSLVLNCLLVTTYSDITV